MSLLNHLEDIKTLLEDLESKPQVKLFSGTLSDDDMKNLKIDGVRPHILLGSAGGPIPENRVKLEVDSVFGAFIIAKSDPSTVGLSTIALNTATQVAKAIEAHRGNPTTSVYKPVLKSMEELFSGVKNGTNFSAWQVIWTQRIVLI